MPEGRRAVRFHCGVVQRQVVRGVVLQDGRRRHRVSEGRALLLLHRLVVVRGRRRLGARVKGVRLGRRKGQERLVDEVMHVLVRGRLGASGRLRQAQLGRGVRDALRVQVVDLATMAAVGVAVQDPAPVDHLLLLPAGVRETHRSHRAKPAEFVLEGADPVRLVDLHEAGVVVGAMAVEGGAHSRVRLRGQDAVGAVQGVGGGAVERGLRGRGWQALGPRQRALASGAAPGGARLALLLLGLDLVVLGDPPESDHEVLLREVLERAEHGVVRVLLARVVGVGVGAAKVDGRAVVGAGGVLGAVEAPQVQLAPLGPRRPLALGAVPNVRLPAPRPPVLRHADEAAALRLGPRARLLPLNHRLRRRGLGALERGGGGRRGGLLLRLLLLGGSGAGRLLPRRSVNERRDDVGHADVVRRGGVRFGCRRRRRRGFFRCWLLRHAF
mmetsp:Transcript_4752/g.11983  ORF Transcript_4752/g.11983 Transcript_4752/m.11983 type:complete len:441 (-) Transcript_4752:438-1760(-)